MQRIVLGIEHTNPSKTNPATVAVCEVTGDIVRCLAMSIVPHGQGERVTAAVEDALNACSVVRSQIDEVAVSLGPGGFTSTRIGVVAAQMIATGLGVGVRGVPTVDVAAQSVCDCEHYGVALAHKGGLVWFCRYNAAGSVDRAGLTSVQELDSFGLEQILCGENVIEAVQQADVSARVVPASLSAELLVRASLGVESLEPSEVHPLYPREADAKTIAERSQSA